MGQNWKMLVLMAVLLNTAKGIATSQCGEVSIESPVVVLGSSVTASCEIGDNCTFFDGQDIQIEWRLNDDLIPKSQYTNQSSRKSNLTIPCFNTTQGYLSCFVVLHGQAQLADVIQITAGSLESPVSISTSLSDDHSLWIQWEAPKSLPVTGYVIEWCVVSETLPCRIFFTLVQHNCIKTLITENIEPFKCYKISVYPKYKDGFGLPVSVEAYSKQRAPSKVPKLKVEDIGGSYAELAWDSVPVDERNGFIRRYTIFYSDKEGKTGMRVVDAPEMRVTLENLKPSSEYKAFIMMIPRLPDIKDLSTSNFSKVSVLDVSAKMPEEKDQKQIGKAEEAGSRSRGNSSGLGESIQDSVFYSSSDDMSPRAYQNTPRVEYSLVVCNGYKGQQNPKYKYLRSDSTQPLLHDLSPSPNQCENIWFQAAKEEVSKACQDEEPGEKVRITSWDDFPLLRGLMINEEAEKDSAP
ncbi:Interleukin-6 receptor subunit beta [Acipenser ruthenus]|uniref:Interleukin-6 receptor subunit beta n=1 Tax=Acipenser ruthenus TaxID=7906 RepID=A0A662YJ19_ACIRT|nr:Interleukin-6 receptor subunit beta [Acipenser ruthenus]